MMHNYNMWETQDGRILELSEMHETHIQNCINMLERQLDEIEKTALTETTMSFSPFIAIIHKKRYIRSFEEELKKRVDKSNAMCYNVHSKENKNNIKPKGGNYMKSTGIVRRIDDLGRVVIPKDVRRKLGIREGDPLEIFVSENGVELRKDTSYERIETAEKILRDIGRKPVTFIVNKPYIVCVYKETTSRGYNLKTGTAACNPTDIFNDEVGKAIAYLRMMGKNIPEILRG